MIKRITQLTILPEGDSIFSSMATQISIEDDGSGEYVRVTNYNGKKGKGGEIEINPEEWITLRGAINAMVSSCRKEDV